MKTLNTKGKLIALGIFIVLVTVCAGRVMEAKTGQDFAAQGKDVVPEIREAAINALGPIGFTRGQTLRIGFSIPGPHVMEPTEMIVFDRAGNTLIRATVIPGPPSTSSFYDLNADQLPQQEFDQTSRAEVTLKLRSGGDGNGSFSATAQVFDNLTGKTTFALQAGGHPGGIN